MLHVTHYGGSDSQRTWFELEGEEIYGTHRTVPVEPQWKPTWWFQMCEDHLLSLMYAEDPLERPRTG